jgi:hypothetical protein
MSRRNSCDHCRVTQDGTGQFHHQRDCPEMSFPSGRRRDDPGPMPPIPPLRRDERGDPIFANPGGLSPVTLEFAQIFGGLAEAKIARYVAEHRARFVEREEPTA